MTEQEIHNMISVYSASRKPAVMLPLYNIHNSIMYNKHLVAHSVLWCCWLCNITASSLYQVRLPRITKVLRCRTVV